MPKDAETASRDVQLAGEQLQEDAEGVDEERREAAEGSTRREATRQLS
jgi:hypothetical protein